MVFSTLLLVGLIADTWWNKLDSKHKGTWVNVKAAFTTQWPAIKVAKKMGLDYQCKILALHLSEEEVGKQITVVGVFTWAHLQFHMSLQQLVNEARANTTAGLVYQVRENLPTVIKELTTLGLAEWNKFLDKIKALDTNKLREKAETAQKKKEKEKVQNARLVRLETMQTDVIEVMWLQLQCTSIGSAPAEQSTTPPSNPASRCKEHRVYLLILRSYRLESQCSNHHVQSARCDNLVFFGLILAILTYLYIHYFVAYISMFPFQTLSSRT